ncbi:MAG TPA: type II toxin-antitoxin system RelE/ParE family toxin [Xanthobacteraceae bacterium]|nr:type II toxin-antitoxin system RelE/ParE family toxin [Xanthobacteraceae bacterium]
MELFLSDKARSDLLKIYRYLEERSPHAANAFAHRTDAAFENLIEFPFIGRDRSWLGPGIRCLIVGLHLVFYLVDVERITVVRVIDGRMDVDEEFYR